MSRLELAWETIRVVLRAVEAAAPSWYAQTIPQAFHEAYVERQSDWRLSKEEVSCEMEKAGRDGFWLLDHLEANIPPQVLTLSEVVTLRMVWQQQFERGIEERKPLARQLPIKGKDVIQSPHEPEARWAQKRNQVWVGYKLQVTETAEDEEARFITDIDVISANDGDSEALDGIQERLAARHLKPNEHYVDRGYVSGPNLAHSDKQSIELVGPALADTSRKPEGYKQGDFHIDFEAQKAICPQGQSAQFWRPYRQSKGQVRVEVFFGLQCHDCPKQDLCAPGQKKGRKLNLSPYYPYLHQRRVEQETEAFKERLKRRAGIEGTISELTRAHGARRARYRGKAKVRLQMLFTGAAANLKRLAQVLERQKKIENAVIVHS